MPRRNYSSAHRQKGKHRKRRRSWHHHHLSVGMREASQFLFSREARGERVEAEAREAA